MRPELGIVSNTICNASSTDPWVGMRWTWWVVFDSVEGMRMAADWCTSDKRQDFSVVKKQLLATVQPVLR